MGFAPQLHHTKSVKHESSTHWRANLGVSNRTIKLIKRPGTKNNKEEIKSPFSKPARKKKKAESKKESGSLRPNSHKTYPAEPKSILFKNAKVNSYIGQNQKTTSPKEELDPAIDRIDEITYPPELWK